MFSRSFKKSRKKVENAKSSAFQHSMIFSVINFIYQATNLSYSNVVPFCEFFFFFTANKLFQLTEFLHFLLLLLDYNFSLVAQNGKLLRVALKIRKSGFLDFNRLIH